MALPALPGYPTIPASSRAYGPDRHRFIHWSLQIGIFARLLCPTRSGTSRPTADPVPVTRGGTREPVDGASVLNRPFRRGLSNTSALGSPSYFHRIQSAIRSHPVRCPGGHGSLPVHPFGLETFVLPTCRGTVTHSCTQQAGLGYPVKL
jgi:hypothetical protein